MITINASETAAIVGLNPHKPRESMLVKYRKSRGESFNVMSQRAEKAAISVYERKYNVIVGRRQEGAYFTLDPTTRFYAQIDGVVSGPSPYIIEIKNRKKYVVRCDSDNQYDIIQLIIEILAHGIPGKVVEFYKGNIINETKIYTVDEARAIFDRYVASGALDFVEELDNPAPVARVTAAKIAPGCSPPVWDIMNYMYNTSIWYIYGDSKED